MKFEIIARRSLYEGYYRMVETIFDFQRFDGRIQKNVSREIFERGDSVAVILYDPARDLLIWAHEFRGAIARHGHPWSIGPVAGSLEDGEDPADCARREAMEEAGVTVTDLRPMPGYFPSPGACSEHTTMYFAEIDADHRATHAGVETENEDIEVLALTPAQSMAALEEGRLNSSSGYGGLCYALARGWITL